MIPISVITPTFRVGVDLWKIVLSVQKQLLEGDELIIVDNDRSDYAPNVAASESIYSYIAACLRRLQGK